MTHKTNHVANTFLERGFIEHQPITPMKLQKLVYFFHGWHLAITNDAGIPDPIEAWPYGPVISVLYHEFKSCGKEPISCYANDLDSLTGEFTPYVVPKTDTKFQEIFDAVWEKYIGFDALQLSSLTHEEGSPWDISRKAGQGIIPNLSIKDYFVNLVRGIHGKE